MYDVNILVNGSRCKQYHHDGKIFIEAKDGSEYTIELKNNTWKRILAVCSVDGLDILTGKTAVEGNPGYVISGMSSGKFDGFRVSDEKIAKFVFGKKGASYAASKEDGSERNVGVLGIRVFEEKIQPPPPVTIREEHHHHHHDYWRRPWSPWDNIGTPYNPPVIWCDTTVSSGLGDGFTRTFGNSLSNAGNDALGATMDSAEALYSSDNIPTKGATKCSTTYDNSAMKGRSSAGGQNALRAMNMAGSRRLCSSEPAPDFDMGTKWGEAKESRVIEVEFEKGILALSTNIYYASRQSLIEMGVPLGNEKQVSFPEPFADSKYAKPPKNWRG